MWIIHICFFFVSFCFCYVSMEFPVTFFLQFFFNLKIVLVFMISLWIRQWVPVSIMKTQTINIMTLFSFVLTRNISCTMYVIHLNALWNSFLLVNGYPNWLIKMDLLKSFCNHPNIPKYFCLSMPQLTIPAKRFVYI